MISSSLTHRVSFVLSEYQLELLTNMLNHALSVGCDLHKIGFSCHRIA